MTDITAGAIPAQSSKSHPRALWVLFFTEMWERFSYYGMRALLVLFMTDAIASGGMAMTDSVANAIYGLYTASVYLASLPGGWIADRLIGAQRSVFYGGIIIMVGHFTLAVPGTTTFYLGLMFVVLGTGLLKPNVSAIVGELYEPNDSRRDAGFTLFYMGINLGAFLGPLVCSTLGESAKFGWHWGFAAAGVGMGLGLIQYKIQQSQLGDAGLYAAHERSDSHVHGAPKYGWPIIGIVLGAIAIVAALLLSGTIAVDAVKLAQYTTVGIVIFAIVYFAWLLVLGGLDPVEKKRVGVIIIMFLAIALFWSGFEQAGSSLNLFAERHTDRMLFGFEIPAGWFQSLNPMFILILAPFIAALWIRLGVRQLDPSMPVKFALGLIILGLGFVVMVPAAKLVTGGEQVLPTWLLLTYFLHTTGELCISPVGLSSVTKLAPKRYVGQMMGVWFLGASLGNIIAGLLAGRFDPENIQQMPSLYLQIVLTVVGGGILLLLFTGPIKKLAGGIK